ncbi:ATP-dependent RNA helicase TDRD9-like isoform X2 [Penaeus chinensis]|uniref:ATP-dependent RNA helicase TDRD9-like isoform X2 n=1 Tax=Penaeus chinensis TaxID=139456 RepID=UPI001FB7B5A7|nr:ATP-dependent RNA helicase TDRD9-like isoform X2 [Penaeus chinensis]
MSSNRKFTGCVQDYLDWFKNPDPPEPIVIPDCQSHDDGALAKEYEHSHQLPVPSYLKHNQGTDYAKKYQDDLLQEYERRVEHEGKLCEERRFRMTDIEEDTLTATMLTADDEDTQKTQVYLQYDFSKRNYQSALPVFNARKEVLAKIEEHQVVIIGGETGSGKSTQVPQFILDDAVEKHHHCNIIVTQPRKIAATSLARRVCRERGWQLGKIVGYQVGLDNCTDPDTRLSYVTTEVLVQKLIHRGSLDAFTHIVLDEVHERDQHTDFALLIVKKLLYTVSRNVKVILMSATIDTSKFASYFSTPVMGNLVPAPVVSVGDNTLFKIQFYYLESLSVICRSKPSVLPELPSILPADPGISENMFKLACEIVKCFDHVERQEEGIRSTAEFVKRRGAVLIFLPGLAEIEKLINLLSNDSTANQWMLYPLHSSITQEEQQRVFSVPPVGFRKVIVSTNIAESSITVPDIKYVIDFCLTKQLTCDQVTNYTSLKLAWASQASCKQRAGRAGRVSTGRVYRLVPADFFLTLPTYATPELCRTPLSQIVLKTKILNMGEPHALLSLALDPPNLSDIHRTILTLKQMGALAVKSKGVISGLDGDLTYLGRVAAQLPVDPHLAKFIVMGYLFGVLKESIIIAAGLSLKSFHARPFQDELNAFLSKVSWAYGSFSDCLAILNTYNLWQNMQIRGEFLRPGGRKEREWAKHSYVQLEALKEVDKLVKELTLRLEGQKITVRNRQNPPRSRQAFILKMCMASAFFPFYYKRNISENYEKEMCRELNGHDPFSTVIVSGLPARSNVLYDSQLKELFKECSQNLEIQYEGSKAYVQFPRMSLSSTKKEHFQDVPGECPTSMHLALKMRQVPRIQKNLVLNLYSQEEIHKKMSEVFGSTTSMSGINLFKGSTQSLLGNARLRMADSQMQMLRPPTMPKPSDRTWRIHVTHVVTAGHFWIVSEETSALKNLNHIHSAIQTAVEQNQAVSIPESEVKPGMVCLAKFTDSDGLSCYYRARVDEVYTGEDNGLRAQVFFVDFGNTDVVKAVELRRVPGNLMLTEMLAVECKLAQVKPASDNKWLDEATEWFRNHILNKDFIAQIYSVVHKIMRVKLIEVESGDFLSINRKLIDLQYAVKAEEYYLSKQNHELRSLCNKEAENTALDDMGHLSQALSVSSLELKFGPAAYAGKAKLQGPESPLLLHFVALSRMGCTKGVKIEPSSVNSTALDLEPQNPHDRVNREGTLYTGALIGLGHDPDGNAVYPADDIEASFDIHLTQEDLVLINRVRFLMNIVLEEGEDVADKVLIKTQNRLRELLLQLVDVNRGYREPESYHYPYQWQMVPKEEILHPQIDVALDESMGAVFPLHCGIFLQPSENCYEIS